MDRRRFTLALLAATAPMAITRTAVAQTAPGAIPAQQYLAAASKGSMVLEDTSRDAFEKTANPAVKRFVRAEVTEQVNLSAKLAAVAGMEPAAMPGGVIGGVVAAPFAIAGGVAAGTAGAVGSIFGAPLSSDDQKAGMIARLRAMPGGPAYDAAYVDTQITAHEEAFAVHDGYARAGDDPGLRRVARSAVPLIRLHLSQLARIQAGMGRMQS